MCQIRLENPMKAGRAFMWCWRIEVLSWWACFLEKHPCGATRPKLEANNPTPEKLRFLVPELPPFLSATGKGKLGCVWYGVKTFYIHLERLKLSGLAIQSKWVLMPIFPQNCCLMLPQQWEQNHRNLTQFLVPEQNRVNIHLPISPAKCS
jgi:hypothetical protein